MSASHPNMHNLATLIKRYVADPYSSISLPGSRSLDWIGLHSCANVAPINRLEAATSRLEDMATSVDESHPSTIAAMTTATGSSVNQSTPVLPQPQPLAEPLPRAIEEFDKFIAEDVNSFVAASEKLGDLVKQQVEFFAKRGCC